MKAAPYASLRPVITALRPYYGKPVPPISRDPFHLILWEQVGYLVPDAQRRVAFAASALLRQHGQELCRRRAPACERCPLRARCPSAAV